MKKAVMKRGLILAFLLVLVLGTGALAADVKVSGEVGYNVEMPTSPGYDAHHGAQYMSYTLTVDAVLSEQTSAKLELFDGQQGSSGFVAPAAAGMTRVLSTAVVQTKLNGLGTLAAGINPDYGTSPFAVLKYFKQYPAVTNYVWGFRDPYEPGISFASEKHGGFAGQVFFNPWSNDFDATEIAGELTYNLPVLAGTTVGLAFDETTPPAFLGAETNTNWALVGNVAVNENLSVYGEVGQVYRSHELNDKSFGARAKVGAAKLVAEAFFDPTSGDGYYLQADYPFQDLTLSASYLCGDGWAKYLGSNYFDGLLKLSAKVTF